MADDVIRVMSGSLIMSACGVSNSVYQDGTARVYICGDEGAIRSRVSHEMAAAAAEEDEEENAGCEEGYRSEAHGALAGGAK